MKNNIFFKTVLSVVSVLSLVVLFSVSTVEYQRMDEDAVLCVDMLGHELRVSDTTGEWRKTKSTILINSKTGKYTIIGSSYDKPFNSGDELLKKFTEYDTYAYGTLMGTYGWTEQDMLDWLAAGRPVCQSDPKTGKYSWDHSLLTAGSTNAISSGAEALKTATTVYNGKDYKDSYNAYTYYNNYPDLQKAFGTDANALIKHYVEHGIAEGRKAK